MSIRKKFIVLAGACAIIAAVGSGVPGADAAICNPCRPAVQLWIQGTQGNQSLSASYGGSNQVDFQYFPSYTLPSEPPVTFRANTTMFQDAVQVQATDTLSCESGGGSLTIQSNHYSSFVPGSASISYQPNLKCPPGYLIWSSDQTARAVDTYGYTTPFVSFNWGLYGA